jgi:hypothetical protein
LNVRNVHTGQSVANKIIYRICCSLSRARRAVEFGSPSKRRGIGYVLQLSLQAVGSSTVKREQRHPGNDDEEARYVRKDYPTRVVPK